MTNSLTTEVIDLCHRCLTANDISLAANNYNLSKINTLKLGFNQIKDDGLAMLAKLLSTNETITSLDVGFNDIGDSGIKELANCLKSNSTIKVLYLSGNLLTAKGFYYLGDAIGTNKTLKIVYLTGNSAKQDGATYLAKGLAKNTSIVSLFFNCNKIDGAGAKAIASAMSSNRKLKFLNLSDNNIADGGAIAIGNMLQDHKNFQVLELSFNNIGPVGMVKLCSGLLAYHSMQKLLLDNNILNDNGAKALAGALPHMSLRELNVGFNEIGADGLATIIEAIKQCPCLRTLNVSGNVINNQVARDMANMLIQNTTLVSLYLDNTSISPVGEKYIAAGIATNRKTGLRFFKGFDLGRVLTLLGSPAHLEHMNNTDTLQYLAVMWEAHSAEVTKTDHANDISGNKLRSTTINSNSSKQSDGDNTCSASGYSSMSSVRHDSAGNFTDDNKKLLSFDNFSAVNLGHVESLNIPAASSMKSLIKPVKSYEADFSSFPFLNRLNDEKSHDNVDEALTNPSEKLNIYLSSNVNLDLCVVTGANHRQQINAVVHDGGLSELQHPQQAFSPKLVTRLSPEAFTLVAMAKSIAKQVFRASDLFELHQYYFSPPASYGDSTPVSCGLISCAVTTSEETESDSGNESDFTQDSKRRLVDTNEATSKDSAPSSNIDGIATRPKNDNNQSSSVRGKSEYPSQLGKSPRHFRDADLTNSPSFKDRPKKKPVNRQTMPRIAYYPKIKNYLEAHQSVVEDRTSLVILRQLNYLEKNWNNKVNIDLESLFFDEILNQ